MPREFVLLTPAPVGQGDWLAVADVQLEAGCEARAMVGGLLQMVRANGAEVLSAWPSRELAERREADAALEGAAGTWMWWTDATVPVGDVGTGQQVIAEVARRSGGTVMERN